MKTPTPPAIIQAPTTSTAAFRYVGGDPSLDFVNTADWLESGPNGDRFASYDRLVEWAEGAGFITTLAGAKLRRSARARERDAVRALERGRALRLTLRRVFLAVAEGTRFEEPLEDLNSALADALVHLRLVPGKRRAGALAWAWENDDESLDALLRPVVRAAGDLLASEEAARIRVCAGADCGWMYVDRSRNKLRRWCQMETCGTTEKTRRRRASKG